MRFLSAALVAVGLVSASPAYAQASPSNYTTGYRYDAARRLVGTISPDPDGSTGPLHYAAVRNSYDPVTGELVTVEKGELPSWKSESVAPASWGSAHTPDREHCSTINGKYSIYANGDRLRVAGSSHLLVVVIDALDKRLEQVGWETADAFGKFTICYSRDVAPRQLTNRDEVRVVSYSGVRITKHDAPSK